MTEGEGTVHRHLKRLVRREQGKIPLPPAQLIHTSRMFRQKEPGMNMQKGRG